MKFPVPCLRLAELGNVQHHARAVGEEEALHVDDGALAEASPVVSGPEVGQLVVSSSPEVGHERPLVSLDQGQAVTCRLGAHRHHPVLHLVTPENVLQH